MSLQPEASHQQIISKIKRPFWGSSLFFSKTEFQKIEILYSFYRQVGEITGQSNGDPQLYLRQISWELQNEKNVNQWVCELKDQVLQKPVAKQAAKHMVDAALSGLTKVRMHSQKELLTCCYQKAGTVGVMMCPLLNVSHKKAYSHAIDLGIAMQITTICLETLEDSLMNRVYLAADILKSYGIEPDDLVKGSYDPETLKLAVSHHLDLAAEFYERAKNGFRFIPLRKRFSVIIAANLHQAKGDELAGQNCDLTQGKICVGRVKKLWIVTKSILSAFKVSLMPGILYPSLSKSKKFLADLPGVNETWIV